MSEAEQGAPPISLVLPPGEAGTLAHHEGSAGLGSVEQDPDAFRYPPHTLALVAATTRQAGYAVTVRDALAEHDDVATAVVALLAAPPGVIGVQVSWGTREADARFLAALRARLASVAAPPPVVALGVSVPHMMEHLRDADYALVGEPELAFPALCARLLGESGAPVERVVTPAALGVAGYDAAGFLTDLDALPFPAWELLPVEKYPFLSVLGSRGCERDCSWCPYVVAQGRRYRACSPHRVAAELSEVVRRYHPRRIIFRDPAFAHDAARVVALCHAILATPELAPGKNLVWECESHPDHLSGRLLAAMCLAGCSAVKVGLETTAPGLLAREGRLAPGQSAAAYLAHLRGLARDAARLGVFLRLYALAGLPGQTLADAQATARFARALPGVSLSAKALHAYPGAALYVAPHPGAALADAPLPTEEEVEAQRAALVQDALHPSPRRGGRWVRSLAGLRRAWWSTWLAPGLLLRARRHK
jgi:anaerobic magnesium-protoporphyrin IX monomethyl ester cyclase